MPERPLLLTAPIAAAAALPLGLLGALVSADALLRRARRDGDPLEWAAVTVAGGHAAQRAAEQDLVREGLDRASMGVDAFVERVRSAEQQGRQRLNSVLAALGVGLDLAAAHAQADRAARVARVAFVRLFDAGLVADAERVVDVCPWCTTVVGATERVGTEVDGEVLTLRLAVAGDAARLDVRTHAPELLPGVVAVVVPEGHPAAGSTASVPLAPSGVPVVGDPAAGGPALVVPAHDEAALELARRSGLAPVPVVDGGGTVRSPGPLDGLARHAARAAARLLLEAEGAVAAAEDAPEPVHLCPQCRTVLVPRLGRHWFLAMGELEVAAADLVRDGTIAVRDAACREELLAASGRGGDWCLSRQVWAGQPLPVAQCRDCGNVDVSVEVSTSCRRCMGRLEPAGGELDDRFVRCTWPLGVAGWPDGGWPSADPVDATVLVPRGDVVAWVLPAAALALRLAGAVPFRSVAVVPAPVAETAGEAESSDAVPALVEADGRAVVRTALLCGGLELGWARDLVRWVSKPPAGAADVDALAGAVGRAMAAGSPGDALGVLAAALRQGVPPGAAGQVRALAAPLLGE